MERKVSGNSISSLIGERLHVCSGCNELIKEQWLLEAADKIWHESCLKCSLCHGSLAEMSDTFYAKADLLLCKRDYFRLFGQTGKCSVCQKEIASFELVMRARGNSYHLECFACQSCNKRFCVGDRFYLHDDRILCEDDYGDIINSRRHVHDHLNNPVIGTNNCVNSNVNNSSKKSDQSGGHNGHSITHQQGHQPHQPHQPHPHQPHQPHPHQSQSNRLYSCHDH